jgi:hypothetical protein
LLGCILFLDRKVRAYSISITCCSRVLSRYSLEVTVLALLRKGDSGDLRLCDRDIFGGFSGFGVYNTSVKL